MTGPVPPYSARSLPSLMALCIFLGISALFAVAVGLFMLTNRATMDGVIALVVGVVLAVAAVGLYRLRRWGTVAFGLLVVSGSINYLAGILQRYTASPLHQPMAIAAAVFNILLAIAIPIVLIYLTIILWRQTR